MHRHMILGALFKSSFINKSVVFIGLDYGVCGGLTH